MPGVLQPSFARGELSPSLYARVDLAVYQIALKTARNLLVRPYGGVANRAGTMYVGAAKDGSVACRLIPFVYSTTATYILEVGDGYIRFYSDGGRVLEATKTITGATAADPVVVTAVAHGYASGEHVVIESVAGMSELNGRIFKVGAITADTFELESQAGDDIDGSAYGAYTSGGTAAKLVEVETPWATDEIFAVQYTQSADVMLFAHPAHPPQKLSRTSLTSFTMAEFETTEGPFRDLNPDEEIRVASSAATGIVTITANSGIFTADMVGMFFSIENKNFSEIKPWVPGEHDVTVGMLKRSEFKTYKCSAIPSGSYDWIETGGVRPTHEKGRAWDGGGDERENGDQTYAVGVEWEFQDFGFGIVQITGYTSATQVTAFVTKNLPAGVVGGVGAPANTWNLTGDGSTTAFAIAGATSTSYQDYTVTVAGVPTSSGQYPPASGGIGGGDGDGDFNNLRPPQLP